jgi:glycosyltransferase involved in cell wall biosynthesis
VNIFEPKISIITVSLNSAEFIEGTIKNVRSQTYPNIEYIVIDGGSTDGTAGILKQNEELIDYWVSEPDKGISDAFNKGVLASTGQIVGFMNSQDYYTDNDVVRRVVQNFAEHPHASIVYGKTCYVPVDSSEIVGIMGMPFTRDGMRKRNIMPHQSTFMKRDIFERYGYYSLEYRYAMDYEHLLRVTETETPLFIDELLAAMRLGGISDTDKLAVNKEIFCAQRANGVVFLSAFMTLLYHYMTATGLGLLRMFDIYTLDHLYNKLGFGKMKKYGRGKR